MEGILNSLLNNKEWLFSGLGIFVITGIWSYFKSKKNNVETKIYNTILVKDDTGIWNEDSEKNVKEKSKVDLVVDRFIKVYEAHGIQQNQIVTFVDKEFNLKLKDFKNNESILEILDNDLIEWTCNKFGVKRDWIDGTSDRIYESVDYYKEVPKFIKDISELVKNKNDLELFAFKEGELDRENEYQDIVLLIRYSIGKNNSQTVYRYTPISTCWKWGYWRSRYQLKSIFYICEKLHIFINGYDLKDKKLIAHGKCFPSEMLQTIPISITWYPEDYVDLISQNFQAKEIDETEKVREYIKQENYIQYLNQAILNLKESQ